MMDQKNMGKEMSHDGMMSSIMEDMKKSSPEKHQAEMDRKPEEMRGHVDGQMRKMGHK